MIKKKRGQVSFFIILGVLLVIIVGFVIYIAGFATKERSRREVITTQQMPTEIQEINNYVVSCLQKVTMDGLELIGKRGGRITMDEGGTYNPRLDLEGIHVLADDDGVNVRYAIKNIWAIQGVDVLPPLDAGANPIYDNLMGYIKNALVETNPDYGDGCLEYYLFRNKFDTKGFSIDSDPASIQVELNITDDVEVHLKYPLTITNKRTGEKRELEDFYVIEKIRLRMMYKFLKSLVTKDVNSDAPLILVDASGEGKTANDLLGVTGFNGFEIKDVRQKEVIRGGSTVTDDIIEVEDKNPDGKPYLFRFARMSRT